MKLQFKDQQFQTDAVQSVVGVFAGQPNMGPRAFKVDRGRVVVTIENQVWEQKTFAYAYLDTGYKNSELVLDDKQLLSNIRKVQTQNKLHQSNGLAHKLGRCQLDVEMETGTGKTYVYTKTMFELNKHYGWTKFIIVVPSVAIREGVKKSLDITAEHFMAQYGKKLQYFVYNSDRLEEIDHFADSGIRVMIINTQAFNTSMKEGANNKVARIIFDKRDEFGSRRPIDVIATNRPILILDEPQKMGGDATQKGLAQFAPLFTLNYSATHREAHNMVYVLDALDAYRQKLVKKIEVVGMELLNLKGTEGYIFLSDIILSKTEGPKVRLEFEVKQKAGTPKRKMRILKEGDNLFHESGELPVYNGFVISEINVDTANSELSNVRFSNDVVLHIKEYIGNMNADNFARIQIRETIKAHFRKERELFRRGIKCLSLFFLDEVANYRQYDDDGTQRLGNYGKLFEELYNDEMNKNLDFFEEDYNDYLRRISTNKTHAGYFSIDKKGRSVNSELKRGSDVSDDISAYDLILKNKERLLSLNEPVRFIFSHSALREGWDNPNVFQICFLRNTESIPQKRQEVGRGLRLCVDSEGVRQDVETLSDDVHKINKLTVIANESYKSFAENLQRETLEALADRPTKADVMYFSGKTIKLEDGQTHTFTQDEALEIWFQMRTANYISESNELTPTFHKAVENNTLEPLKGDLAPYTEQVHKLMQGILDPSVVKDMIENGNKQDNQPNALNANFHKKEFQELWGRINHKLAYVVDFDSNELIEKAVAHINKELNVSELMIRVTRGEQEDNISDDGMKEGGMFVSEENRTVVVRTGEVSNVKYDLLGEIAKGTKLTRKTVATILYKISEVKFNMYKTNPEEFIRKVTEYINDEKATVIVEYIGYDVLDETYDSSIFTEEKHSTIDNAYKGKKHILDYVFTDGTAKMSVERRFVEELDKANEVVVYAKLPKGFHIPTPVGNYSPDWAIAFQEGAVKHVYFVAETKGSMSSLQLREIERCKIDCAKKLFEQMSAKNVKYDKVDSFETLMNLVK